MTPGANKSSALLAISAVNNLFSSSRNLRQEANRSRQEVEPPRGTASCLPRTVQAPAEPRLDNILKTNHSLFFLRP